MFRCVFIVTVICCLHLATAAPTSTGEVQEDQTTVDSWFPVPNTQDDSDAKSGVDSDAGDTSVRTLAITFPIHARDHPHPLCEDRLADPKQIKEIDDVESVHDVIEFLIYRLCQPQVTAEEVDKISAIIEELTKPKVEDEATTEQREIKKDPKKYKQTTLDSWFVQPKPKDHPCKDRLENPEQIKKIDGIESLRDVIEFLIYRLCQPHVTAEELDQISAIVEELMAPKVQEKIRTETRGVKKRPKKYKQTTLDSWFVRPKPKNDSAVKTGVAADAVAQEKPADIDIDPPQEVEVQQSLPVEDIDSDGQIDDNKDREDEEKPVEQPADIPRDLDSDEIFMLREIVESELADDENEAVATEPSDTAKSSFDALCKDRLVNPDQINDIAEIKNLKDVIEYLIYRLCNWTATTDDVKTISKIAKIAAKVSAVVYSLPEQEKVPIIGYPNPFAKEKPTLSIEPLPEAELKPLPLPVLETFEQASDEATPNLQSGDQQEKIDNADDDADDVNERR